MEQSRLFDLAFYRTQKSDVPSKAALAHYLAHGNQDGTWPNPLFDTAWYLEQYPDIGRSGTNALLHYVDNGEAEGRQPNATFNPTWYADRYGLPSRRGALLHYLTEGRARGVSPAANFNPRAYVAANSDLSIELRDALAHHLYYGRNRHLTRNPTLKNSDASIKHPASSAAGAEAYRYVAPMRPTDLAAAIETLSRRPLFSIVTPVYNVPARFLRAAIESVTQQWYPYWELILVDDASTNDETVQFLDSVQDERIQVSRQSENRGIALTTNNALQRSKGDYVVFLDNDDELTADCLFELARAIARTDADFLYSDEDKIDQDNRYASPFFKPAWSPDALMSIMYTCHVSCMRRSLVEACGWVRSGYDGAQDYDLTLRVAERADRIVHIPKVLYHWRTLPSSLAARTDAKPYAHDAVRRLKEDALQRRGVSGTIEPVKTMPGQFHVRYNPRSDTLISLIILTKNNGPILSKFLDSLYEKSTWSNFEILVVDNGSTEPETLEIIRSLRRPNLRVRQDSGPFNFSALNNRAAAAAKGDVLIFLNDDMEVVTPDWMERLAGYAQLKHVGAVGAKLYYPSGQIQHCGILNLAHGPGHAFYQAKPGEPRYYGRDTVEYNWIAVTGACLAIERAKFSEVGGFDETLPIAYNDVELGFRLVSAGYYNVVCQTAELIHYESLSRGSDTSTERRARLKREAKALYAKHPRYYMRDPFFSENLHPNDVYFSAVSL